MRVWVPPWHTPLTPLLLASLLAPGPRNGVCVGLRAAQGLAQGAQRAVASAPARWEGLVLHFADTLRRSQHLSALHFLCRNERRCPSDEALKRYARSAADWHCVTLTYAPVPLDFNCSCCAD